ncbi:MAG: hypothetical protein J6R96_01470 [Spirochaetaceae bacterium]|nr:hypothetical protein [Spirochaetaceae bacterium]
MIGFYKTDCTDSHGNPKRRYYTYAEAEDTRRYIECQEGILLRSYHCPDCGYYHLTKQIGLFRYR